jgi:dephospho-CoA kinase
MTIVIGLTGGIGSGKSTIAGYLADLGAAVIDADKVGHEAFKAGTPAWHDVVEAFGRGVVAPTGEIDRKKLGQIVFDSAQARERLNRIMWSRIWEMISQEIDGLRRRETPVVVVEAFGLIEAGWAPLVDRVWVTVASEKAVLERLKLQRQLDESDTLARIRSQLSNEERTRHADVVIENEGLPEAVRDRVKLHWESLRGGSAPRHAGGAFPKLPATGPATGP